jgi:hypothetical protein
MEFCRKVAAVVGTSLASIAARNDFSFSAISSSLALTAVTSLNALFNPKSLAALLASVIVVKIVSINLLLSATSITICPPLTGSLTMS